MADTKCPTGECEGPVTTQICTEGLVHFTNSTNFVVYLEIEAETKHAIDLKQAAIVYPSRTVSLPLVYLNTYGADVVAINATSLVGAGPNPPEAKTHLALPYDLYCIDPLCSASVSAIPGTQIEVAAKPGWRQGQGRGACWTVKLTGTSGPNAFDPAAVVAQFDQRVLAFQDSPGKFYNVNSSTGLLELSSATPVAFKFSADGKERFNLHRFADNLLVTSGPFQFAMYSAQDSKGLFLNPSKLPVLPPVDPTRPNPGISLATIQLLNICTPGDCKGLETKLPCKEGVLNFRNQSNVVIYLEARLGAGIQQAVLVYPGDTVSNLGIRDVDQGVEVFFYSARTLYSANTPRARAVIRMLEDCKTPACTNPTNTIDRTELKVTASGPSSGGTLGPCWNFVLTGESVYQPFNPVEMVERYNRAAVAMADSYSSAHKYYNISGDVKKQLKADVSAPPSPVPAFEFTRVEGKASPTWFNLRRVSDGVTVESGPFQFASFFDSTENAPLMVMINPDRRPQVAPIPDGTVTALDGTNLAYLEIAATACIEGKCALSPPGTRNACIEGKLVVTNVLPSRVFYVQTETPQGVQFSTVCYGGAETSLERKWNTQEIELVTPPGQVLDHKASIFDASTLAETSPRASCIGLRLRKFPANATTCWNAIPECRNLECFRGLVQAVVRTTSSSPSPPPPGSQTGEGTGACWSMQILPQLVMQSVNPSRERAQTPVEDLKKVNERIGTTLKGMLAQYPNEVVSAMVGTVFSLWDPTSALYYNVDDKNGRFLADANSPVEFQIQAFRPRTEEEQKDPRLPLFFDLRKLPNLPNQVVPTGPFMFANFAPTASQDPGTIVLGQVAFVPASPLTKVSVPLSGVRAAPAVAGADLVFAAPAPSNFATGILLRDPWLRMRCCSTGPRGLFFELERQLCVPTAWKVDGRPSIACDRFMACDWCADRDTWDEKACGEGSTPPTHKLDPERYPECACYASVPIRDPVVAEIVSRLGDERIQSQARKCFVPECRDGEAYLDQTERNTLCAPICLQIDQRIKAGEMSDIDASGHEQILQCSGGVPIDLAPLQGLSRGNFLEWQGGGEGQENKNPLTEVQIMAAPRVFSQELQAQIETARKVDGIRKAGYTSYAIGLTLFLFGFVVLGEGILLLATYPAIWPGLILLFSSFILLGVGGWMAWNKATQTEATYKSQAMGASFLTDAPPVQPTGGSFSFPRLNPLDTKVAIQERCANGSDMTITQATYGGGGLCPSVDVKTQLQSKVDGDSLTSPAGLTTGGIAAWLGVSPPCNDPQNRGSFSATYTCGGVQGPDSPCTIQPPKPPPPTNTTFLNSSRNFYYP